MSKLIYINNEYAEWVKSLSLRFRQSQVKAAVKVNSEIVKKTSRHNLWRKFAQSSDSGNHPQVEGNSKHAIIQSVV